MPVNDAERRAKNAAKMRRWRANNPPSPEQKAKEVERVRQWREENPEQHRAYQQKWCIGKRQGLQAAAKAKAATRERLTMAANRDDRVEQQLGRKLKALRRIGSAACEKTPTVADNGSASHGDRKATQAIRPQERLSD
ncbi:hypothetical protein [Phyllobacterium sp. UNC302MFCol5.2]|uniref:hypothetical protein n=1 Tax=Phyllobacterium sp. UNC302MFCol5.2 TaxID=1449065 RepID=UPI000488A8D4|nr:hypothetical protein [Phyllobacterium sp. UNC302MFCol5.2]